mgnify:CR=1 FL=1
MNNSQRFEYPFVSKLAFLFHSHGFYGVARPTFVFILQGLCLLSFKWYCRISLAGSLWTGILSSLINSSPEWSRLPSRKCGFLRAKLQMFGSFWGPFQKEWMIPLPLFSLGLGRKGGSFTPNYPDSQQEELTVLVCYKLRYNARESC